ncbi:MAG: OmpA family protein [Rhodospirillales bacterium]|jgi:OOP family OmpA-OmpF porin|nr:OmpA family protein [Rhodospirillales bacterium]
MSKTVMGAFLASQVLLALILAGCGATFDYDALRRQESKGEHFTAALSREYKAFALYEADSMYDWPDAAHFGDKAMLSARGVVALPERIADWRLPGAEVVAIGAARARLIAVLDGGARHRSPAIAARAQARFDCWLEQQEENWQVEHIARCRDGLQADLARLEGAGLAAAYEGEAGKRPPAGQAFALFFGLDRFNLQGAELATVDAIAAVARRGGAARIVLGGHADRAGTQTYNRVLSMRRAKTVRDALVALGVSPARILSNAYGETRPRVETPDGMAEPRNRRVEVMIGPAPAL